MTDQPNMPPLSSLPNIAKVLEPQLRDAGIGTVAQLKEADSREAWLRILARDPSACLMRLYSLEGAVQGVRWHHLGEDTKQALKSFYHEHKHQSV